MGMEKTSLPAPLTLSSTSIAGTKIGIGLRRVWARAVDTRSYHSVSSHLPEEKVVLTWRIEPDNKEVCVMLTPGAARALRHDLDVRLGSFGVTGSDPFRPSQAVYDTSKKTRVPATFLALLAEDDSLNVFNDDTMAVIQHCGKSRAVVVHVSYLQPRMKDHVADTETPPIDNPRPSDPAWVLGEVNADHPVTTYLRQEGRDASLATVGFDPDTYGDQYHHWKTFNQWGIGGEDRK